MIWPFPPASLAFIGFLTRNRSWSRSRMPSSWSRRAPIGGVERGVCARKLGKPAVGVSAPPWLDDLLGSRQLLDAGSRSGLGRCTSSTPFSRPWVLAPPPMIRSPTDAARLRVKPQRYGATSTTPLHLDAIASRAVLPAAEAARRALDARLGERSSRGPSGLLPPTRRPITAEDRWIIRKRSH